MIENEEDKVDLICRLLHISKPSYYRYKNRDRKEIILLLEKYFSAEDLATFLKTSTIPSLEANDNFIKYYFAYKFQSQLYDANIDIVDDVAPNDLITVFIVYLKEFFKINDNDLEEQHRLPSFVYFCLYSKENPNIVKEIKKRITSQTTILNHNKLVILFATTMTDSDFFFLGKYFIKFPSMLKQ